MGAPKGNKNALRHGLYATYYNPEIQSRLRKMAPGDARHELMLMRVVVNNLFGIHGWLMRNLQERMQAGEASDVEPLTRVTNSLSLAITALNTTARTYALLRGKDRKVNDAFETALNSMTIFLEEDGAAAPVEQVNGLIEAGGD